MLVSSGKDVIFWREASICLGVPSKSLPHDKLNIVSPVKIARDPGKYKLIWPASIIKKIRDKD